MKRGTAKNLPQHIHEPVSLQLEQEFGRTNMGPVAAEKATAHSISIIRL